MKPNQIHVIGGGTFNHIRPHLSLAAPAFGKFARQLICELGYKTDAPLNLHLTKMAFHGDREERALLRAMGSKSPETVGINNVVRNAPNTNSDLEYLLQTLTAQNSTHIIFLTAAIVDFDAVIADFQWDAKRLSSKQEHTLALYPAKKLVRDIRKTRKDIFLVACKTTWNATADEMFFKGLELLKSSSCNLVLVNDIARRVNMIVTPEQARYFEETYDRGMIASKLVDMALSRAKGTFTRTTLMTGGPIPWNSSQIPDALRTVVNHCITQGAYKDILGTDRTVGHFAVKLGDDSFLTSRRNTNFNNLSEVGMVYVEAEGDDRVRAFGSKPSVGGQSQRIIFREHPETDCIVHAHVPLKNLGPSYPFKPIPKTSQFPHECGSHQCGQNTSSNLQEVAPGIKAVYLENHGPNIVFHHSIDPNLVIDYINQTFDLSRHTGESLS